MLSLKLVCVQPFGVIPYLEDGELRIFGRQLIPFLYFLVELGHLLFAKVSVARFRILYSFHPILAWSACLHVGSSFRDSMPGNGISYSIVSRILNIGLNAALLLATEEAPYRQS